MHRPRPARAGLPRLAPWLFTLALAAGCSSDGTPHTSPGPTPIASQLSGGFAVDEGEGRVYFAVKDGIRSATLADGDERALLGTTSTPRTLRLDAAARRLYWTDGKTIASAGLAGGGVREVAQGNCFDLDRTAQAVFFGRSGDRAIYRVNATGGNPEAVLTADATISDLAIDDAERKLYWLADGRLHVAGLDGSGATVLARADDSRPQELAINAAERLLYLRAGSEIHRRELRSGDELRLLWDVRRPAALQAGAATTIYWLSTEHQEIWAASFARQAETVLEDARAITGSAVDAEGARLYWSTGDAIHTAPLAGTSPSVLLRGIATRPERVRVDAAAGQLYVRTEGQILRVGLDDADPAVLVDGIRDGSKFVGGVAVGADLAIDTVNRKLYWTQEGPQVHSLMRADLDGQNAVELAQGLESHLALDVDPAAGKIFYSKSLSVVRADLDGGGAETILDPQRLQTLGNVIALRVDRTAGKLYVLDIKHLYRANLDGSAAELLVDLSDAPQPRGLAIDEQEGIVYWRGATAKLMALDTRSAAATPRALDSSFVPTEGFAAASGAIYVATNDGHIARLDASAPDNAELLVVHVGAIGGLAAGGGKLYWVDTRARWIGRCALDGSGAEILHRAAELEQVLALDAAGGALYFSAAGDVARLPLDSLQPEPLTSGRAGSLTLGAGGDVYFLRRDVSRASILRYRASAGEAVELLDADSWSGGQPRAVAFDAAAGLLYVQGLRGELFRLAADGADATPIAVLTAAAGLSAHAAHVHAASQSLYFASGEQIVRFGLGEQPLLRLLLAAQPR